MSGQTPGSAAAQAAKDFQVGMESGDAFLDGAIDATSPNLTEGDVEPALSIDEAQAESSGAEGEAQGEAPAEGGEQAAGEESKAEGEGEAAAEQPKSIDELEEAFSVEGQEIKVKWDPQTRKRLVHAAHQRAKFQRERDQAVAQVKELKGKADNFDTLNQAFVAGGGTENPAEGFRALARALKGAGADSIIEQLVQAEIAERQRVAAMSPEEQRAYQAEKAAKQAEAAYAAQQAKIDAAQKEAAAKAAAVLEAKRQSDFDSEFKKVSFHGKLKDEALAERLDRQVFAAVKGELETYFEKVKSEGGNTDEIDVAAVARKLFKPHVDALRKFVSSEVKEKVSASVAKAKDRATSQAQAVMAQASGGSKGKESRSTEQIIAEEGIVGALRRARGG